ncbi:MAG: murein transglycosylase domain-containing protein, partial [Rikenellaceae bacterium]
FVKELGCIWGDENVQTSTKYTWVEYGDAYNSRSVVDFENESIAVEVILSDEELKDENLVRERLCEAVASMLTSRGKSVEYKSQYIPQQAVSDVAIMNGVVDLGSYGIKPEAMKIFTADNRDKTEIVEVIPTTPQLVVIPSATQEAEPSTEQAQVEVASSAAEVTASSTYTTEVKAVADAIIKSESVTVTKAQSSTGSVNIAKINPKMASNFKYLKAKELEPIVDQYAVRYNVDKSLIYGVIETESMYDPLAVSGAPAYGLMQIVPRTAGVDAYEYLHKKRKIVSRDYLFNSQRNIEMGVVYLMLLQTRSFHKVTDPRCRELCVIAAYNTGMGNVGRSFTGHTTLSKAIPMINAMGYDKLYTHLRSNLVQEASNYVKFVSERRVKYRSY